MESSGKKCCSISDSRNSWWDLHKWTGAQDFAAAGFEWTVELCKSDSDGDGFSNGEELGDPCCVWRKGEYLHKRLADWPVTHPGFANSTPTGRHHKYANSAKLCEDIAQSGHKEEGKETLEFVMDEVPLTINSAKTGEEMLVFQNFAYNLPANTTYDIIGIERWFEKDEILNYLVKHDVCFCPETTIDVGPHTDMDSFADPCVERMYMWNMGTKSSFRLPDKFGFRAGKGTRRLGFAVRLVYRAPREDVNFTSIKSGLRFNVTNNLRKHEIGVLRADTLTKTGVIPLASKVALSSLFQIKVDKIIAPGGVTVVGYAPGSSQHYQTCKTWIERLNRTSGRRDMLRSLTELHKVEDLGRDVTWFDGYSRIRLNHGDYFSFTCLLDTSTMWRSPELERCHSTLYYYPADAMNQLITHVGPVYITQLNGEESRKVESVEDLFSLPSFDTQLPLWRKLYLSGTYKCNMERAFNISNTTEATHGISPNLFQLRAPCRKGRSLGNFQQTEGRVHFDCSEECAYRFYNVMGCALLADAKLHNGELLSLFPSPLEGMGAGLCGKMFRKMYKEYTEGSDIHLALHGGFEYGNFGRFVAPHWPVNLIACSVWMLALFL